MSNFKGASDFAVLDSQLTFTTNHYYHQFQDGEAELAQHLDLGTLHPLRDLSNHCAIDATADSPSTSYAPSCHPETRKDVINHIMSWIEDSDSSDSSESTHQAGNVIRIAWLSGPAGSGKSCIQRKVVELCKGKGLYAASFFFSPRSPETSCEKWFVTTLAHQLTQTVPNLKPFVGAAVRDDETIFKKSLEIQIDKLIFGPLELLKTRSIPNVIVVDGLDECVEEKEQAHILRLIQRLAEHERFPFRVLVASRPGHMIQTAFHSLPRCCILRLEEYNADLDIRHFLKSEFLRLKSTHPCHRIIPSWWPLDEVVDALVKQASGQFLYASVIIRYLENARRNPIVELEKIFGYIVAQQTSRDKSQRELVGMLEDVRAKRSPRTAVKDKSERMLEEVLARRAENGSQGEPDKGVRERGKVMEWVSRMRLKKSLGELKVELRRFQKQLETLLQNIRRARRYRDRRTAIVGLEASMRELEQVFEVVPAIDAFVELDALYRNILLPPEGVDTSLPKKTILHTILHARAYPSLTTQTIDTLLGLEPGSTDIVVCDWQSIVSLPPSSGAPIFHHHSMKDFLLSKVRCGVLYQDEVETKLYLTSRYLELSTKQKTNTAEYFNYPLSTLMQATSAHWAERFFQDQLIRDRVPQFIENFFMGVTSNTTQQPGKEHTWIATLTLMHETTCLFSELYHQHLCKRQTICLLSCRRLWRISCLGDEIVALAEYFDLSALERREVFKRLLDPPEEDELFERFFDAPEGGHLEDSKIAKVQVGRPTGVHTPSLPADFSLGLLLLGILILPILALVYPYLRQTIF